MRRDWRLGIVAAWLPLAWLALASPQVALAGADGDGVPDGSDNCPFEPNPAQLDQGGFDTAMANGRGDVCECGDVSDDAIVDVLDWVVLERGLAVLPPGLLAPRKCGVVTPGVCDAADVAALRDALAGGPTVLAQACPAGQPGVAGDSCGTGVGCQSAFCTDGVCCTTSCAGTCERCDVSGFPGTCTPIATGQDPDAECGGFSCSSYFAGFVGDVCHQRANTGGSEVACNGSRTCQSAADLCPGQGVGPVFADCDDTCETPAGGTCVGTTPGVCTDLDMGNQTCGIGACQNSTPVCLGGFPNTCTPGAPSVEVCNDVDDDCNALTDDGLPADPLEPNGNCPSATTAPTVGSNVTINLNTATVYPVGDIDYWIINALETDSTCSCCDLFCTDEDFQLIITVTVPPNAGSYELCSDDVCSTVANNCVEILAGQQGSITHTLDGGCPGTDAYTRFVRIRGDNAPASECTPYTLRLDFVPGCF